MASVAWLNFRGIRPLSTPEHDVSGTAEIADNVDLRSHRVETWRAPGTVGKVSATAVAIQRIGSCWITDERCATYAMLGPECDTQAIRSSNDRPQLVTWSKGCATVTTALAIPTPETTPVVALSGDNGYAENNDARAYAYAYTRNGDHGSLSPISSDLVVADNAQIAISNLSPPPLGYGVDGIVVFRRMAGFITGRENVAEHVTRWVAVRTIGPGGGSIVDSTSAVNVLGQGLDIGVVYGPPDTMRGIVAFKNAPGFVGFYGQYVAFSEGRLAHSWPLRLRFNLGVPVRSVHEVDGIVHVITDASPFVFNISNGVDKGLVPREITNWQLGMVRGSGEQAVTEWNGVVIYVSRDGLVRLNASGAEVITEKWFTPAQWRRLKPEAMQLCSSREFLFLTTPSTTYLWQMDTADQAHMELTTTTWKPRTMTVYNDEVFGVVGTTIQQWNTGSTKMQGRWRSTDLRLATGTHFTSVEVKANNATRVMLLADGLVVDDIVVDDVPQRLARYGRSAQRHAVELSGPFLNVGAVYLALTHRDQFGAARNG